MESINLDDYYIPPSESDENLDILNIFIIYYKKLYNTEPNYHLFQDINFEESNSTNRSLELLYSEILKYKNSKNPDKDILYNPADIDISKYPELFILKIQDENKYISKYLFPILKYIASLDWKIINWNIIPIR